MAESTNPEVFGKGARLLRPRQTRNESESVGISGVDLMRRINEGLVDKPTSAELQEIRTEITKNCEEIIEQGARVRPLMVDKIQKGWVRGLHLSERKLLNRRVADTNDFLAVVLKFCTTLSSIEIDNLASNEVRRLAELIAKMSEYDLSLFPYLSAYTTTSSSENLWFSQGTRLTSYENRPVPFFDGGSMTILCPPDHAKLWATLCNYREISKSRLDASFNTLLMVQTWAGKNADPFRAELKAAQRDMQVDSLSPWEAIVQVKREITPDDGWGHSMDNDSVKGLQQEMRGILAEDKHEQFMKKFYEQQRQQTEDEKKRFDDLLVKHGKPGVTSEVIKIVTETESRQRERDLKKGRPIPVKRDEGLSKPEVRIQKYS